MKVTKIWFDIDNMYVLTADGNILSQSLRYYPRLKKAAETDRQQYFVSTIGIHWRNLDVDVSFESFEYDITEPKLMYVG